MQLLSRVFVILASLLFLAVGLGFWVAPAQVAQPFGIEAVGELGLMNLRADLGGLFVGLALLIGVGAWTKRRSILLAAILLLSAIVVGRLIGGLGAGQTGIGARELAIELAVLAALFTLTRTLREPTAVGDGARARRRRREVGVIVGTVAALAPGMGSVRAGEGPPSSAGELARKVANPLASLISVPLQCNFDEGIGPADLGRSTLNVQPVVPISLGREARVKLLLRTVAPIIWQEAPFGRADISGFGDVTQSIFVAPVRPTRSGWFFGAGPVVQLPTGSEPALTTDHWSLGPTAILVRQVGPWTYGALANHLWSVAGDRDGSTVSTSFAQPFINYITKTHTTLALNTETSRDWEHEQWSVPINLMVNQLLKVGPRPMSLFVGARYWVVSPDAGPSDLGFRAGATLLFPTNRKG
ncbi:MAG: hypothetical protein U0527_11820 [Candidatus Eisenbacteria bacterium]